MNDDMVRELRILGEGTIFDTDARYVIPRYQRAYAWEDKEIVQLIDDIYDRGAGEVYYIGSLVVSRLKGREATFEVVDGQQRLTTLYLLLHYLVSEGALEGPVGRTLSFDCREHSNHTLGNIQQILAGEVYPDDEERIEQTLLNGLKAIRQKFTHDAGLDPAAFVERLRNVILYRIEVPEHTDLNRYFEIMNTRGEQLEQHDILKARLMRHLDGRAEQEFFARVWNACSDMTGYVQMHFAPAERRDIFGGEWNGCPSVRWEDYAAGLSVTRAGGAAVRIHDIVAPGFRVDDATGAGADAVPVRFDSVIDFPNLLLHVLRVFVSTHGVSLSRPLAELLDDKRLIADFAQVIDCGTMDGVPLREQRGEFARRFVLHLLRCRFLFDKFIVKREYTGDDTEGVWSLKELFTSGQASRKKAYYLNTRLRAEYEWERTYAPRAVECMMIQSALRVSYTSPKVMHWITELLQWVCVHDEYIGLTAEAERIAARAVRENFIDRGDFAMGVKTPHVVFNFLDYLLWKGDKRRYGDFVFEFRNSVEHWYPQNPSDGSFDAWTDRDTFGNLCIISRSVNSKFSNLSPESKMKSYGKMVSRGSLKLRLMGELIGQGSNEAWVSGQCREHERQMLSLLRAACEVTDDNEIC